MMIKAWLLRTTVATATMLIATGSLALIISSCGFGPSPSAEATIDADKAAAAQTPGQTTSPICRPRPTPIHASEMSDCLPVHLWEVQAGRCDEESLSFSFVVMACDDDVPAGDVLAGGDVFQVTATGLFTTPCMPPPSNGRIMFLSPEGRNMTVKMTTSCCDCD